MADKFIRLVSGQLAEREATVTSAGAGDAGKIPAFDTNGRLTESVMSSAPTASSAGAGDAGKLVKLDGTGKIDNTMMPAGVGSDSAVITASENLSAGDFVNLWDDASTIKVRKADASNGRRADGFVLAAVTSGNPATVYFEGSNNQLSSLTLGATYYLSGTTAGAITATAPSTSGQIVQEVGRARLATALAFEPQAPITLA